LCNNFFATVSIKGVFDNTRFYHAASYIEQAERGKKKQDEDVWAINWSDDGKSFAITWLTQEYLESIVV